MLQQNSDWKDAYLFQNIQIKRMSFKVNNVRETG